MPGMPDDGDAFSLLGPLSLDIYVGRDLVLPGGGALNMAWWWRRSGDIPFELLSRVGSDRPEGFLDFLARHAITVTPDLVGPGASSSIDVAIRADRQPWMDNFVESVWSSFALTGAEEERLHARRRLHLVLVEGAIRELERLSSTGALDGVEVTADFLGFRHYTPDRLAATLRDVQLGFIGWPGAPTDPELGAIRAIAERMGRLLVVTLGAQGVQVFDGRSAHREDVFLPVTAVDVRGTTVGCGDAFIAGFLAEWRRSADVRRAVVAGAGPGADATAWRRPLPDEAYGMEASEAVRRADDAAARSA